MLRRLTLAILLFAASGASAETWRATYLITAAGIAVMEADVEFSLGPAGAPYSIETRVRGRGVAGMMFRGESRSRSEGQLRGAVPAPSLYRSTGNWRGSQRRTTLEYAADGTTRVALLEPLQDTERTPIRLEDRQGAIDSLSALVALTARVRETARCDMQTRTYDGRRLIQFDVVTDPIVHVADRGLLRCLVESRPVAGYPTDRPVEEATRPTHSVLVFGVTRPGAPAIPVRIEVASRWWGSITATQTGLTLVQ